MEFRQIRYTKSISRNFSTGFLAILMILSQTTPKSLWSNSVFFLALPLFVYLILRPSKSNSIALRKVFYLISIVVLGLALGLIHLPEYNSYYFARDIMYFVQAPIYIIIGIYLCKNMQDFKTLLKVIILTTLLITLYKLIELVINPSLLFQSGLEIRKNYDLSNYAALMPFIILFYSRKLNFKLFRKYIEVIIMSIFLFSIAISFSRTTYLLLLATILLYYVKKQKYIIRMYWAAVLLVLFIVFGGLIVEVNTTDSQGSTFQSKIEHSLDEIVVKDYNTKLEISNNWRGYEAFLGLSKFYEGNVFEILVGQGFGTVVYTPYWIFKSDNLILSVLPMFHNGFITILLKTGLLGLIFFFLFLYHLLKTGLNLVKNSISKEQKLAGKLLQAIIFVVMLSTLVVHGIFATTAPLALMLLIGYTLKISTAKKKILVFNQ